MEPSEAHKQEIIQQLPEENLPNKKSGKKKYIVLLFASFFIIVFLAFSLVFVNNNKLNKENSPKAEDLQTSLPDSFFKTSVLSSSISDLDIKHLPNSRLIRGIAYYKDSLWVSGDGSLIEYDASTNKIKKFSDPKLANCDSNIVIVGDFLYAPCRNLSEITEENQYPSYSIYKINLKTQSLEKIITDKDGLKDRNNFEIYSDGENLWLATFEGIAKISTKNDEIKYYTDELGIKGYGGETHFGINNIIVDKDYIWAVISANAYSTGGVSKYDKKSGLWTPFGPNEIHGEGADTRVDFNGVKLVNDGIRVAYDHSPSNKMYEKEYLYSEDTWKLVNNQFDATGENYEQKYKYLESNYKPQSDHEAEDQEGIIQIYSKDGKVKNQINGRAFLWISELINNKRYLVTSSSLDVLKNGESYPNIIFNFGKNIDYSQPHPTEPDFKFIISPDGLHGFVIDPAYYPGFESPEVWETMSVSVVDLKNDKLIKKFSNDTKYDWRRNFMYESELIGSGGKKVSAQVQEDIIQIIMDEEVIMEYNKKNQTLEFKGAITEEKNT